MTHYCSYLTCFKDAIGGFCYLAEKVDPTKKGIATSLQYKWIFWCAEHEEAEKRLTEGIMGQHYDLTKKEKDLEVEELRRQTLGDPPAR